MLQRVTLFFSLSALLFACKPESETPPATTPYEIMAPAKFQKPFLAENNPLTQEGIALGRMLFYEKKLSADNSISCGTCHQQKFAFTDGGKDLSLGVGGALGKRNTMSLANVAWLRYFNWDGSARTLEEQARIPIEAHIEMNQDMNRTANKLQNTSIYPPLFLKAFGSKEVTPENILKAIAQFERTLVSANTRYDQWIASGPIGQRTGFTADEEAGYKLFSTHPEPKSMNFPAGIRGANCFHCHAEPHFRTQSSLVSASFFNNGMDTEFKDNGFGQVEGNVTYNGKFKPPTLRNIALTAPYMHDGRFKTLDDVIRKHYNSGVKFDSPGLDNEMTYGNDGQNKQLGLTEKEIQQLIAFLNTLTDNSFVTDPRFSDPFADKN